MDKMFNKAAAAKYLRISVATIDRRRKQGKIACIKNGKLVFFTEKNLTTFLDSCAISVKGDGGEE
jgi:predicted site-specific integrase-resolvase